MHGDIKVVQQMLTEDEHSASDPLTTKEGSSILGKYINGARNNFRGFNSIHEDKHTSPNMTVHQEEEEEDKGKVDSDTKPETDMQQSQVGKCGAEGSKQVTECDVVKMEEGRVKVEPGDERQTELEAEKEENTDSKVKREGAAGTSFNNVEGNVKGEATQDEAEEIREGERLREAPAGPAESLQVSKEKTDITKFVDKFKGIELQEKKAEVRWGKGRKLEHNVAETSGVKEGNDKPGAKKTIPSPTGSSSSQDTGFGSQEAEGSIDGLLVTP